MTFGPIRTSRLLLRPVRIGDAAALAERRSDPDVARLQSWEAPYPLERAEQLVADLAELDGPVSDEWWMLTIADLADTAILGDLAIHPTWDGRSIEIGYSLARVAWGHGYAVEAVAALVERLFEDHRVTRLHAMMHPDNVASAQVLERTGFEYEGRTQLSYWVGDENTDDVLYGMTREGWERWRGRSVVAPERVELIEISATNLAEVRNLVTHKSQERFVSPVVNSLGTALFPPNQDGVPTAPWLRAVRADGELVGFVMVDERTDDQPEPCLWRLLIDRMHQRRGIGARVVDLVIADCRASGAESMTVFWVDERGGPKPLYLAKGFEPTGLIEDGEIEARLQL